MSQPTANPRRWTLPQHGRDVGAERPKDRSKSHPKADGDGNEERDAEDGEVDTNLVAAWQSLRREREQAMQRPATGQRADGAARQREQHRLSQDLSRDTAGAGTDGASHGDLALATPGADESENGETRAHDEDQERDCGEQH